MRGVRPRLVLCVGAALALAGVGLAVWARGGVYTQTAHGDTASGVLRLGGEPRGDCAHCHDQHASRDGVPTGGPFPYVLFAPNDNQLCATAGGAGGCHASAGDLGIYPGPTVYDQSSHQTSPAMVWPGPDPRARAGGDAGFCINCHTPHGSGDANGLVPALAAVREEGLCGACHDASGPALANVMGDLSKPYRHPVTDRVARHDPAEDGTPTAYGLANRHAECSDCHNPHDVREDAVPPTPPSASSRTRGVGRVSVSNGPAGTLPTYTYRAPDDPTAPREYEICFKCHSSWTTQPAGQADMARRFNSNNPSYHPVEAQGKNTAIRSGAFVNGWQPTDLMYCGDCHGSDDPQLAGPHGSIHDNLLVAPFPASPAFRQMSSGELCFGCHRYATYADKDASDTVQGYSRWNAPEEDKGHAWHNEDKRVTCYSCHDVHGSTSNRFLLVFGRNPGLNNWIDEGGGQRRCFPACHGDETYRVNY